MSYVMFFMKTGIIGKIFTLAHLIWLSVCLWKLFTKAGRPGWKVIIPIYRTYVQSIIVCGNPYYFLVFVAVQVGFFLGEFTGLGIFALVLGMLSSWLSYLLFIYINIKTAKAFGKDDGFTLGMIFLQY